MRQTVEQEVGASGEISGVPVRMVVEIRSQLSRVGVASLRLLL
jgi:hypothetical protein